MTSDLLGAFELHSPDAISQAIRDGADPLAPIEDKPPIMRLIEIYTRSARFADCLRAMMAAGASVGDPMLEAILLDDAPALERLLDENPNEIDRSFDLACAFTSLRGSSALHVCAEYGSIDCAKTLIERGLAVDVRAALESAGHGAQTPIFHTVNSSRDFGRPMMELLVAHGARVDIRLDALVWGLDCEWETTLFDVTPVSYAQCGLLPQFHRDERQVYQTISTLIEHRDGRSPAFGNVPNAYIDDRFDLGAARAGQRPIARR